MGNGITAGVESERKYDVPDGAALPDFGPLGFTAETVTFELRATYFDTPDRTLAANRITLRRREGGHDAGWHLKTPGDENGRIEHHAALADGLPDEIRALVSELLGNSGDIQVQAVARLETQRTATTLRDADGAEVVELADDTVTATDEHGRVRTWREWEAELLPAAPEGRARRDELLDRIEGALLRAGAVPSTAPSKIARATGSAPLPSF